MTFGKFSVAQIIQNASCGLFCFEINTREEYLKIRKEAAKVDSELVLKWDSAIDVCSYCEYPYYLNKRGDLLTKFYAVQNDYYIVSFEDIEFNLPTDINTYVCNELNNMQDHRKEQVVELVKKLAEEERSDLYWYIDSDGRYHSCRASEHVSDTRDRKNIGNYFATKEEAEFECHRRLAVVKWKRLHDKVEKGRRFGRLVYFPCYDKLEHRVIVNCSEMMLYGGLVFSCAETCKRAIEDLGEMNVRDYILEVKD